VEGTDPNTPEEAVMQRPEDFTRQFAENSCQLLPQQPLSGRASQELAALSALG
jgi:hypothetical protein